MRRLAGARKRFGLKENAKVYTCHEAGRDGFAVHRWLEEQDVAAVNHVIDAASMKVNRKKRRAKTDKIDVGQLLRDLVRYVGGDGDVWSVVRVPSAEEEDQRRPHREQERLKKEKTQHSARSRSLLATQGTRPPKALNRFLANLNAAKIYNSSCRRRPHCYS